MTPAAAKAIEREAPGLPEMVKETIGGLTDIGGQVAAVEALLIGLIRKQKQLLSAFLFMVAQELTYRYRKGIRVAIKHNPCPRGPEAIEAFGAIVARGILEAWAFEDGRCLADLRGKEIAPYVTVEKAQARGHRFNARFLEAIAARTPANGIVRNYTTPEEAASIVEGIQKELK